MRANNPALNRDDIDWNGNPFDKDLEDDMWYGDFVRCSYHFGCEDVDHIMDMLHNQYVATKEELLKTQGVDITGFSYWGEKRDNGFWLGWTAHNVKLETADG